MESLEVDVVWVKQEKEAAKIGLKCMGSQCQVPEQEHRNRQVMPHLLSHRALT